MAKDPQDPRNKVPPPGMDEEFLMLNGKRVKVGDLSEAEAKDIIRSIIREKRAVDQFIAKMFSGAGISGLFAPDDVDIGGSTIVPAPDKLQ